MPWAANPDDDPAYWAVTLWPPPDEIEWASGIFYGLGVTGLEFEDGQSAVPPFTDIALAADEPFVRAYFVNGPDWPWTWRELVTKIQRPGWRSRISGVQSRDWANNWKQYYTPIDIGYGYMVVPAWYEESTADDRHTVWIDPGMAFGTGTHPTTRMCLQALADADLQGKGVLDVGAGSGILAILAQKRGAARVTAVEPDPVAVSALTANLRRNGIAEHVEVIAGTLEHVPKERRYEVVVANLIADLILAEWDRLTGFLAPGGLLMLSGILDERVADVRRRITDGRRLIADKHEGGWAFLVVT